MQGMQSPQNESPEHRHRISRPPETACQVSGPINECVRAPLGPDLDSAAPMSIVLAIYTGYHPRISHRYVKIRRR